MKRIMAFLGVMLTVLAVNRSASADEEISDVTEYKFTDDTVMGELVGTEGVSVTVRHAGPAESLIKVRLHFVKEMLKSVETM